jgi:hypothetical protein
VRVRLIVPGDDLATADGQPIHRVFAWPHDTPIPERWREVEVDSTFRGTKLVSERVFDLCKCGHNRQGHALHREACFDCDCLRFRETD